MTSVCTICYPDAMAPSTGDPDKGPQDSLVPARATVPLVGLETAWLLNRGTGLDFANVLFIDFDGVLHPEHHRPNDAFSQVDFLWDAIRSADTHGALPIVVTSDWRLHSRLDALRSHFPAEMQRQIVGVTPDLLDLGGSRQSEIEAWMEAHALGGKWLAIDDRPRWFELDCPHLFVVPGTLEGGPGCLDEELGRNLEARLVRFLGRPAPFLGRSTP